MGSIIVCVAKLFISLLSLSLCLTHTHTHTHSLPPSELRVMAREQKSDAPIEETFEGAADISIPGDVVGGGNQQIRMASFLFRNLSGLLPDSLNGTTSDDDK